MMAQCWTKGAKGGGQEIVFYSCYIHGVTADRQIYTNN